MLIPFSLDTDKNTFYRITGQVTEAVRSSGIKNGFCLIYCPHTTAGITINEAADPDVVTDMMLGLAEAYPDRPAFRHAEGNSSSHLKASAVGSSATVIIEAGRLRLGTWQGIYFCEFDAPRSRDFYVKIVEG